MEEDVPLVLEASFLEASFSEASFSEASFPEASFSEKALRQASGSYPQTAPRGLPVTKKEANHQSSKWIATLSQDKVRSQAALPPGMCRDSEGRGRDGTW